MTTAGEHVPGDGWSRPRLPARSGAPRLTVTGGVGDPRSAHAVDVDAVHHAARRYRAYADELATHAEVTARLARASLTPDMLGADGPLLAMITGTLLRCVADLRHAARDRQHLADQVCTAVLYYARVDEEGAARFRRLLDGDPDGIPMSRTPWDLERDGVCSSIPHPPDDQAGFAPLCPEAPSTRWNLEDLYPEQRLRIAGTAVVPSTGAPGLGGVMQSVHDAYGARSQDGSHEVDAIDVVKRVYRRPDGSLGESYVVALPGTSRWDLPGSAVDPARHRTMRPNLEGVAGVTSAEARLVPEALAAAGVPDGASVLIAGHSQGGMTAMAAAALPAMRRYDVQVLTAGSPVARSRTVPTVKYLHVAERTDVVPGADLVPNRPLRNQVTVTTGHPHGIRTSHAIDTYVDDLDDIDRRRAAGEVPEDLERQMQAMEDAGHLRTAGDDDAYVTTRVFVERSGPPGQP